MSDGNFSIFLTHPHCDSFPCTGSNFPSVAGTGLVVKKLLGKDKAKQETGV